MQAASLSPEMCIVVDRRISLKAVQRGKPTVCKRRKATVLGAVWRVRRTPPGSESGACIHRGNSGTWESQLSPCRIPGMGDRVTTSPGVAVGASTEPRADHGDHELRKQARYRGSERQAKPPETGRAAVVAVHSTGAGGAVRPKRPTGGKATAGQSNRWPETGKRLRAHHP